jgi:hypothetical protein
VVSDCDSLAWTNLVLPLSGHNLSICSRDGDASIEADLVVSVGNSSSESSISSNRAVVWSLVTGEACRWPSIRLDLKSVFVLQDSIFLLDTVPRFLVGNGVEDGLGQGSEVRIGGDKFLVGGVFPCKALAKNQDVVSLPEGVREESSWFQDDFRVFCGCHVTRRSVKVPGWNLVEVLDSSVEGSALGSHLLGTVDPDVLCDDSTILTKVFGELKS